MQTMTDLSRITPAYAGKRSLNPDNVILVQDHPRLCGEKANPPAATIFRTGSPPPMRGKEWMNGLDDADERITPAYAGKSQLFSVLLAYHKGSPPPMRGKG